MKKKRASKTTSGTRYVSFAAMRKGNQPETINISFLIIGDIP